MCTSKGQLLVAESFNPDSADAEILYALEDDELVFRRKKNKERHINLEEVVVIPSFNFFDVNGSDPFALKEMVYDQFDEMISSSDSDSDSDDEEDVSVIQQHKNLPNVTVDDSKIVKMPEMHSFTKEPAHKEDVRLGRLEEKFFWKEKAHERIRRMRKVRLMEKFVLV